MGSIGGHHCDLNSAATFAGLLAAQLKLCSRSTLNTAYVRPGATLRELQCKLRLVATVLGLGPLSKSYRARCLYGLCRYWVDFRKFCSMIEAGHWCGKATGREIWARRISWVGSQNHQGRVNGVSQISEEHRFGSHLHLLAGFGETLNKGTVALALHFHPWRELPRSLIPQSSS